MNRSARRHQARESARRDRGARTARRGAALAAGATLALSGSSAWLAASTGSAGAIVCGPQTVSSTADGGAGSLRAILAAANDGDTITFGCVANQTITVTTPLTIGKFVTLDGGANNVIISGNDATRVLQLDRTRTGTGTVTLKNLTVTHGRVNNEAGAGLLFWCGSTGIDLGLDGMTFSHHSPTSGTGVNGAGIYVDDCGDVTVTNSDFLYNTTTNGGVAAGVGAGLGVRESGTITISGSTFAHNAAGSAINVNDSAGLSLTDTDLDHNERATGGAALHMDKTPLTMTRGQMTHNTATAGFGGAAALYFYSGTTAAFTDVTFSYNSAAKGAGGALYVQGDGSVTITGSTFDHNSSVSGGAVYVGDDVTSATVTDSDFSDNEASYYSGGPWSGNGGAITTYTDLTVTGSTFTDDQAAHDGGAIVGLGATTDVTISTSSFSGNSATDGGAVSMIASFYDAPGVSSLTATSSTFSGNLASSSGGAIAVRTAASGVTVANSTLVGNTATGAGGGAIGLYQGIHPFLLAQSTLTQNTAFYGGGVAIADDSTAQVVSGSILVGNTATSGDDLHGVGGKNVTANGSLIGETFGITLSGDTTAGTLIADVHLGALADNGGPTKTMALGEGSVAIDAGPSPVATFTGNTTDQRGTGYDRVVNSTVDVGAFEVQVGAPPAPTGLHLTSLGGRSARLTWSAPASGPTPDGYQIRCLPQGTPFATGPGGPVVYVGSATTSADIPDLVGGTTYVCYVRARYGPQYFSWLGDSNEGPMSAASNSLVVARTAPPVPGRVTASTPPQPSGQATSVSFVAPENRSGAPVTRYDARCTSSNGGTTRSGTGAASPIGVTNLTKGRTYTCVVSAVNSVGPSAWSAGSRIVVPAGPATDVRATTPTASARKTTVSFTAPDGGPVPTGYWVECRTVDGSSVLTAAGRTSPVTVSNLVRGRTYTCRVWALFEGGVRGPVSAASTSIRVP